MKLFRHVITMICIVASSIAHAGEPPAARAKGATNQSIAVELQRLQGIWEGVVVGDEPHGKITITITGNSFHFHRDANFWFETTIALPVGKDPRQLHATIKDCAPGQENSIGKVVVAIYKIEDGTLTLAARGDGDEETPKSFEATEDRGLTRYELRKVQPQKKNAEPPKSKLTGNAQHAPAAKKQKPAEIAATAFAFFALEIPFPIRRENEWPKVASLGLFPPDSTFRSSRSSGRLNSSPMKRSE